MLLSVSTLLLAVLPALAAPATQSAVQQARDVLLRGQDAHEVHLRGFRERRDFSSDASRNVRRHFVLEDTQLAKRADDGGVVLEDTRLGKRADDGGVAQLNSSGPAPQRGANGGPFYHTSNTVRRSDMRSCSSLAGA